MLRWKLCIISLSSWCDILRILKPGMLRFPLRQDWEAAFLCALDHSWWHELAERAVCKTEAKRKTSQSLKKYMEMGYIFNNHRKYTQRDHVKASFFKKITLHFISSFLFSSLLCILDATFLPWNSRQPSLGSHADAHPSTAQVRLSFLSCFDKAVGEGVFKPWRESLSPWISHWWQV